MWGRFVLALAAVLAVAAGGLSCAEPGVHLRTVFPVQTEGPRTGLLATEDGRRFEYQLWEYNADRHALADARVMGDVVVARSQGGRLLRFDRTSLAVTHELVEPQPVTALGAVEGDRVAVGFADGRIALVQALNLAREEGERVPGQPRWIGRRSGGGLLVLAATGLEPGAVRCQQDCQLVVHDLAAARRYALPWQRVPDVTMQDSQGRLWFAQDNGEWGGACAWLDLASGAFHEIAGPDTRYGWGLTNVLGFLERPGGVMWVFGGMSHMGDSRAQISVVDPAAGRARSLVLFSSRGRKGRAADQSTPWMPITHLLEDPARGELVVLSYSSVFRVDPALARWRQVQQVELRYSWGRPDAVGYYPAVSVALREGGDGLLLATRRDGLVRTVPGHTAVASIKQGRLPRFGSTQRIERTREGTLLVVGGDELWRLRPGGWQQLETEPETPPQWGEWGEARLHVRPDGSVFVLVDPPDSGGDRVELDLEGGQRRIRRRIPSLLIDNGWMLPDLFFSPDGQVWGIDLPHDQNRRLVHLVDGRWKRLGRVPCQVDAPSPPLGFAGQPVVYLNAGTLLLLSYPAGKKATLTCAEVVVDGQPVHVRGAIVWSEHEALFTTDRGIYLWDRRTGRATAPPFKPPGESVRHVVRDGGGRVWFAGKTLYRLDAASGVARPLTPLPCPAAHDIEALGADAERDDGVVAAVGGCGVAFLRPAP